MSTERLSFPEGKEFEGIDIRPDVESELPIDDLRQGQDLVFEKAMELAQKP